MKKANRKCILIFGTVGSGKSVLCDEVIRKQFQGKINIIILDPLLEYEIGSLSTNFNQFMIQYKESVKNSIFLCQFSEDTDIQTLFKFVKEIGNCLLVVEEAELYLDQKENMDEFYWLIKRGRHNNISLLCISQRPTDFPTSLRAQYTSIFSFRQLFPADIKRLEELGASEKQLTKLPVFQFGKNDIHECYITIGESLNKLGDNL